MPSSDKRWLLLFLYLIVACMVTVSLGFILIQFAVELFFKVFYGLPIDLSNINVLKCIKAGSVGGAIGGIGCWFIYFRQYRK